MELLDPNGTGSVFGPQVDGKVTFLGGSGGRIGRMRGGECGGGGREAIWIVRTTLDDDGLQKKEDDGPSRSLKLFLLV
jgi:hypothetical protein